MKGRLLLLIITIAASLSAQQKRIILDADTGNEVDDLYAIVRALIEPSWEITALNAAQWQSSQWAVDHTMEESHRLNQVLVSYLKMNDEVPTLRGGIRRMNDWGDKAQHSAAAYEIIKQAHSVPDGGKQTVVVLGALTNVASALYIDPGIASKINVYWLGLSYDFEKDLSKRIDFNAVMDPQATEIMLSSMVEMHIIPHTVSAVIKFDYAKTVQQFEGVHPLTDFLLDRWESHLDAGRYWRTIWDLGLIGAMIHPEWAEEIKVNSFENPNIWIFKTIDANAIIEEFYSTTTEFVKKL